MGIRTFIISAAAYILYTIPSHASVPDGFIQINNNTGLSNSSVTSIFQDSDDVMWFGTWNGLNRYDGASIILNASITAYMGLPGFGLYAATKAAVRSFARSWTTDLKSRGIRVNAVSPGVIPTEGYEVVQGMSAADVQAYADRVSSEIPLGRVGTSEELGDAVVFLASDLSKYITGIELTVDGGMTQVYAGKN